MMYVLFVGDTTAFESQVKTNHKASLYKTALSLYGSCLRWLGLRG